MTALNSLTPDIADLVSWRDALPAFMRYLTAAAGRAHRLDVGEPWHLAIEQSRIGDDGYRAELVSRSADWRSRRLTSTVYVFAYDHIVPAGLLKSIVDDAHEHCATSGGPRAFAQRSNKRPDSRCLYVGHALKFDERMRQHLGDGPAKTSALNLKHWMDFPCDPLVVQAYAFAEKDIVLAKMLEEYLWDTLQPVLGRRGGR